MNKEIQETKVYAFMKAYGSITTYDAFNYLHITRLSARIFRLRERGIGIITTMQYGKDKDGNSYKYGVYTLENGEVN